MDSMDRWRFSADQRDYNDSTGNPRTHGNAISKLMVTCGTEVFLYAAYSAIQSNFWSARISRSLRRLSETLNADRRVLEIEPPAFVQIHEKRERTCSLPP